MQGARLNEVLCTGDEIGERVPLVHEHAIRMPVGAEVATAAHVRDGIHKPPAAACVMP